MDWGWTLSSNLNFRLLFLFLVLSLVPVQAEAATLLSGRSIESTVVRCIDPKIQAEAEIFFPDSLGSTYSDIVVSNAIKEFQLKWPVYTIRVVGEEGENGLRLVVDLDVRPILTRVKVRGNDQVRRRDIVSKVGFGRGDRAHPTYLKEVQKRLTEYYFYRGFPKAEIAVDLLKRKDPREGVLSVRIDEGPSCQISDVELSLDSASFSKKKALKLFRVKKGVRCDGRKLFEGARRIERHLRNQGRLSAKISDSELVYSEDRQTAKALLNVTSGPRFQVHFDGNTFSFERDTRLKNTIFFDDEKQFNRGWIESTAKEGIRRFYASQGYPKAEVEVVDEYDKDADLRLIHFNINRGEILRLGRVSFQGNDQVSERDLHKHFTGVAPPKVRSGVLVREEMDLISDGLLAFYQERGFLRAEIAPPLLTMQSGNDRADALYTIREGKPSVLREYRISGSQAISTDLLKQWLATSPGSPIDPLQIRQGADRVEEEYRKRGYKFVKVHLPRLEEIPEGEVEYGVRVEEGPKVVVGDVRIRGNLRTKDYVIARELTFQKGEFYDPEKIKESRRRLLRLGFFESVAVDELPYNPKTGTEDVHVTISERKRRSVAFRPGFSTDRGYRAAVDFGYLNIGGTGRNLTASGRVSRQFYNPEIWEHRAVLSYLEPHLFPKVHGKLHYIDERVEEQQYNIDRRSIIVGLERDFLKWFRPGVHWELEYREPFNVQPGVILSPIDEGKARFGSLGTTLDFDFRDDPLNASRGSFHRIQGSLYNKSLYSEADFMQVYLRNSFYVPIYQKIRSVLAVRFGFSTTYGDTREAGILEIPIEKRFRLGGSSSLRGFGRNCVGGLGPGVAENCSDTTLSQAPGGNSVFNYMLDFLFPLAKGFDLALFTDGGNSYLSNSSFNPADIRMTAGAGIRYNTFFGPLRLDYGIKLDRRPGESFGEIHFAVGQF